MEVPWCSISHRGLCGVSCVLMDNVDTVNVQEGTLVDVARHDLVDEPFDHGLSPESKI